MSAASSNGESSFDLVIIGTGPAASRVAQACSKKDWRIAVVDRLPFGGTCALRGCNPKKALVRAAELSDWYGRMSRLFLEPASPKLDWGNVIAFKREFTDPVTPSKLKSFAEQGIESIQGTARFTSANTVEVDGKLLHAQRFVIATGAEPVALKIEGVEHLLRSDAFLELETLPENVVFVGGGYVSFEFAHVAARAGVKCTIIDRGKRPLKGFDSDLVDRLVVQTQRVGIDVKQERELVSIVQRDGGGFELTVTGPEHAETIATDLVVHGAGRVPAIKDMSLQKAHIASDPKRGIAVDRYLRSSSNPAIFAAGDVADTGAPKLSPVANYEGRIVANNLLEAESEAVEYGTIPSVLFTIPALASVGMTERQAREAGFKFAVKSGDQSDWNAVRKLGQECAAYKLLINQRNDRLIGAHLLGPGAEETINLLALLIQSNQPLHRIKETLLAFPTLTAGLRDMF